MKHSKWPRPRGGGAGAVERGGGAGVGDGGARWRRGASERGEPKWIFGCVRVYLVDYIFCIIDYHICRDIFGRIDILYCRLSYISRDVLLLKTPAPLYICTFIKQYNHLTFGGTPLSNMVIRAIDFFFVFAHL
jgi:hypothetical protein